jgi:hypothetical protein
MIDDFIEAFKTDTSFADVSIEKTDANDDI